MNLRKDNHGKALLAWTKQKPGHIAKPLRFVEKQDDPVAVKYARRAARRGMGDFVTTMAYIFL